MSAIGPGDWVECVIGRPHTFHPPATLVVGQLYLVRGLHPNGSLYLAGVVLPKGPKGIEAGWGLPRFRPVYRPKSSLIETLKQPAPELETA